MRAHDHSNPWFVEPFQPTVWPLINEHGETIPAEALWDDILTEHDEEEEGE